MPLAGSRRKRRGSAGAARIGVRFHFLFSVRRLTEEDACVGTGLGQDRYKKGPAQREGRCDLYFFARGVRRSGAGGCGELAGLPRSEQLENSREMRRERKALTRRFFCVVAEATTYKDSSIASARCFSQVFRPGLSCAAPTCWCVGARRRDAFPQTDDGVCGFARIGWARFQFDLLSPLTTSIC
jgi:hypothetical protein